MQRTVMLEPDQELELRDRTVIGVVSRESVLQALADMEAVVHVAGGGFSFIAQRAETGIPGERVTVGAMLQWQSHTNGRAEPERDTVLDTRSGREYDVVPVPASGDTVRQPAGGDAVGVLDDQRIALTTEDLEAVLEARAARSVPQPPPVDATPVLSPEEAMRAIEEGIPQQPPAIHPDVPSDPEAEDVSEIPEHAR